MGFHLGGRGIAIVEKYPGRAEKYGYIVAASNNSRNGPWDVSERAIVAMTRDLSRAILNDQKRLYATGHSGGARVAMQIA
jgi:poly(3-hydroxybutyrate) depolymerase